MFAGTATYIEQQYVELKEQGAVYSMFVYLNVGEFLYVASCDELDQAGQPEQTFKTNWAQHYVVRVAEGKDVGLTT